MITIPKKVRQSEAMERLKIHHTKITAIRDKFLTEDIDWWREGATIFWTQDAVDTVEAGLTGEQPEPQPEPATEAPETVNVRVLKLCKNPRYFYANLAGERIHVSCPAKYAHRILGKTVPVKVTVVDGQTSYSYGK
jgi:hypothetical protein